MAVYKQLGQGVKIEHKSEAFLELYQIQEERIKQFSIHKS